MGTRCVGNDVKWLPILRAAVQQKSAVMIDYIALNGDESARRIYPLQIEFWGNVWTCTAWCEKRDGFRVFRVDRISSCVIDGRILPYDPHKSISEDNRSVGLTPLDICQSRNKTDVS